MMIQHAESDLSPIISQAFIIIIIIIIIIAAQRLVSVTRLQFHLLTRTHFYL